VIFSVAARMTDASVDDVGHLRKPGA